ALTHGADVVLGPAADGGYYLIGLRGPAPGLFAGIAWGTAGVLEATLARAAAAGLAVHLLSPSFDVDQLADLSRLRALLARDDVSLPRTAGVLAGFAAVLDTLSRPGGNSGRSRYHRPSGAQGGTAMDEWLEEDMDLLTGGEPAPRVLDQRMIREPIRYVAPRPPLCLAPSDTVIEAIRTMREHRIGCVLVVEGERLVGIVTERDFIMKLGQADVGRPLSDFMTPDPEVLSPDDPIVYALNKMSVAASATCRWWTRRGGRSVSCRPRTSSTTSPTSSRTTCSRCRPTRRAASAGAGATAGKATRNLVSGRVRTARVPAGGQCGGRAAAGKAGAADFPERVRACELGRAGLPYGARISAYVWRSCFAGRGTTIARPT